MQFLKGIRFYREDTEEIIILVKPCISSKEVA